MKYLLLILFLFILIKKEHFQNTPTPKINDTDYINNKHNQLFIQPESYPIPNIQQTINKITDTKQFSYKPNNRKRQDAFNIFDDPMFKDLQMFENDEDGLTGWQKCHMLCPGRCLEYGITSNTFCFKNEELENPMVRMKF